MFIVTVPCVATVVLISNGKLVAVPGWGSMDIEKLSQSPSLILVAESGSQKSPNEFPEGSVISPGLRGRVATVTILLTFDIAALLASSLYAQVMVPASFVTLSSVISYLPALQKSGRVSCYELGGCKHNNDGNHHREQY